MIRLILLVAASVLAGAAQAQTVAIDLLPGTAYTVAVKCLTAEDCPTCETCETCPPCEPGTAVIKPGKAHGGYHTAASPTQYAQCATCHTPGNPDGAIPAEWPGSYCPSQAPTFAPPALLQLLGLPALSMYGKTFMLSDGTTFADPHLGEPIVVGGSNGGYAPGETPLCVHCHNHYGRSPGSLGWSKNQIHYGCLDCHVAPRRGDVRESIKDLLGDGQ